MTQRIEQDKTDYLTPGEAAQQLGLSVRTLSRRADDGQLTALRIGKGHRRFDRAEVEALAKGKA